MSLADKTDQLLAIIKWPMAILSLVLLPGAGFEFLELCQTSGARSWAGED